MARISSNESYQTLCVSEVSLPNYILPISTFYPLKIKIYAALKIQWSLDDSTSATISRYQKCACATIKKHIRFRFSLSFPIRENCHNRYLTMSEATNTWFKSANRGVVPTPSFRHFPSRLRAYPKIILLQIIIRQIIIKQPKHTTSTTAKQLPNFFSYLTKSFLNLSRQELVLSITTSSFSMMTMIITTTNVYF